MIKTFIITILIISVSAFIYAIMRTKIVAKHFKKQSNEKNAEINGQLKPLCPNCKTGKASYELDKHSENCPYIGCLKDGVCKFYIPF